VKLAAVILVVVLAVLMPLAHGSPIDPSLPGFWDNGDGDDAVLFLTSDLHFFDGVDQPLLGASETVSEGVLAHPVGTVIYHVFEPGTPRAPPTT
jgi:hypothetical protein